MADKPKFVKLKVLEALQDDAYKGIARIDTEVMQALDLKRGDIVTIEGARETVAIVDRSYPADIGEGIIRIDGLTRKNAKASIGEKVIIKKANIKPAKKITIAPAQQGIMVQGDPEIFKNGLLGRALSKGDLISLGGVQRRRDLMGDMDEIFGDIHELFGQSFGFSGFQHIRFTVVSTNPSQAVIVTEDTEVVVNQKSVPISEENVPEVTYEDIGGLSEEMKKVREMVELPLKHPEVFDKLGIEPPKGVLLHGPPGTGKTLLAKAVANESEANFMLLNGPEIMSKFYGESEKKIRDLFAEAEKNAPSIIFIDEIDAIAPKREDVQGEVERRVVSQLLTMMDGLNSRGRVVVIGATNRPNSIDPALRRPGRFDRELEISVPDKKGRLNILKIHTRNMPIDHWENLVATKILKKKINSYQTETNSKIKEIDTKREDLSKELIILREEFNKNLEELKELERKKRNQPDNVVDKVLYNIGLKQDQLVKIEDKINKNEDKISKIKSDIKALERNIEIINKRKEEISKKNDLLDRIVKELRQLEKVKIKYSREDSRIHFIDKEINKIDNEVSEIIGDFENSKLVSNDFYDEVRTESVVHLLDFLAAKTHGFVGADLSSLAKEAAMNVLRKIMPDIKMEDDEEIPSEVLDKMIIAKDDFEEALKVVRPSAMREVLVETPNVTWNDIGGLESTKQSLREAVEWPLKHRESFERLGIKPPKGILLYGPPGTGKTLLAKAVAKESEANFIQVKGPSLLSMWVGKSEEGVRKIFERARQVSPCVIFFDEIDALAGKRGMETGTKVTERVLNQMLAEMDGIEDLKNVVVIAATNRPDMLDSALLRPGRFDRIILVDVPDKESRKKILEVHTKNTPLDKDIKIENLVTKTEGFVGADIENLIREAALITLKRDMNAKTVAMKDFDEAMLKIKPSVSEETAKRYKKIEEYYLKKAKSGGIELGPVYTG